MDILYTPGTLRLNSYFRYVRTRKQWPQGFSIHLVLFPAVVFLLINKEQSARIQLRSRQRSFVSKSFVQPQNFFFKKSFQNFSQCLGFFFLALQLKFAAAWRVQKIESKLSESARNCQNQPETVRSHPRTARDPTPQPHQVNLERFSELSQKKFFFRVNF